MSGLILLLLGLALYFLPFLIALNRKHHNTGAIFVVNLFLGWTFLGWIWALTWACSYTSRPHLAVQTAITDALGPGRERVLVEPKNRKGLTVVKCIAAAAVIALFVIAMLSSRSSTKPNLVNLPSSEPAHIKTVATIAGTPSVPLNDEEIRRANDKALAKLQPSPVLNSTVKANPTENQPVPTPTNARSDSDPNPPGRPYQMGNGWNVYMEHPIKAKLRDPDSFVFDFATPFEFQRIQGADYWMSAIQYRAKNGFRGNNRDIGMILEKDGHWQFYTGDETKNMRLQKDATAAGNSTPHKRAKHTQ
jgi:hypothetical protein